MWCPKCKMEYQDGITVCADCGTELVEGTAEEFDVVDLCEFKEEKIADRFVEYLSYSGMETAKKVEDEEGVFVITVPSTKRKKAEKLFRGFLLALEEEQEQQSQMAAEEVEQEEEETEAMAAETAEEEDIAEDIWDRAEGSDAEETEDDEDLREQTVEQVATTNQIEEDPEDLLYVSTEAYTTKEEAYKDMKFSGVTFLLFGALGLAYLVLCQTDVIPIQYNIVVVVIISLMFAGFMLMGILNCVKSGKLKLEIPKEQEKTEEILSWLEEKLTEDTIQSWKDQNASEMENDLLLTAHIRASLLKQFPEEQVTFLEYLADCYYTEHFVESSEEREAEE